MRNLKIAITSVAIALVLVSCKNDETPEPAPDTEQFKIVVINEGATHDFTQRMYVAVGGAEVLDAEVTGTLWDNVGIREGDQWSSTTRYFSKKSEVPSGATYKIANDLDYLRYHSRIEAKEGTESTMKTSTMFYRAGKRIGEKNFTISGKGGEFVIDYHDDYDSFDSDNYLPL